MRRFRLLRGIKPVDIIVTCFVGFAGGLYIWVPIFRELEEKGIVTRKDWAKSISLLDSKSKSNPDKGNKTEESKSNPDKDNKTEE